MKEITIWREATEQVAKAFVKRYFKGNVYGEDTFWVADRVGDVFCVADYFFNVDHMIEALELKATSKKLFDFYDMELEYATEGKQMPYNFRNYVKYVNKLKIVEEE